jgi:hypothetical protein
MMSFSDTGDAGDKKAVLESDIAFEISRKELEIWQHLKFLQINNLFGKGTAEEEEIWTAKIKVLQELLAFITNKNVEKLNAVISQNQLYTKGWFSKTDVFVKDVMGLVSKCYKLKSISRLTAANQFRDIRLQESLAFKRPETYTEMYKEVGYSLQQKKVEINGHIANLKLNLLYNKGDVDECTIWHHKIGALEALLTFIEDRDIGALNAELQQAAWYNKGWFSKTDVFVKDVKNLVSQLPRENPVMTKSSQRLFDQDAQMKKPVRSWDELERAKQQQNEELDGILVTPHG